jgi:quercetin dioxygenase-like cupin family protein
MSVIVLDSLLDELVTPKHSKAQGCLITGEQLEVGILRIKSGEGAQTHSHPHEQIIIMLEGELRLTLDGEVSVLRPGHAVHIRPNVPHSTIALQDTRVVSCKGVVDGVGHRI